MQSLGTMGSLTPFIPIGGGSGLIEKRISAYSNLGLADSATFVGNFNHSTSSVLLLDDGADGHLNHGGDPATQTLNILDSLDFSMVRVRSLTSNLSIADHVHVVLEGYRAEPSDYDLTANENIAVGQPVYVSGNNTVNLADASDTSTANVIGFAISSANATESVIVRTEGFVTLADWTTVTGSAALIPGQQYFLSIAEGKMAISPPASAGEVVARLGTAITTTKFDIEVNEVVIL